MSKTQLLLELSRSLLRAREAGHRVGLVIDEAQSLPDELMEEIRLLANIEASNLQLLPVLLVGQPELTDRLNQASLRQLKQRISLRCRLTPLEPQETADYIETRLRTAGASMASVLSPAAVRLIQKCSRGLPRLISVICDNALLSGFVAGQRPVRDDIVLQVCRDLDLTATPVRPVRPEAPARPPAPSPAPTAAGALHDRRPPPQSLSLLPPVIPL